MPGKPERGTRTMNEMKIYRTLQVHAGNINSLVVKLYKGEITAEEALPTAKTEITAVTKKIKAIESDA
jgi:hypothetical protein